MRIEAEASKGQVVGKALGAGASGSLGTGEPWGGGVVVVGRPHQSPGSAQLCTQRGKGSGGWGHGLHLSLLLLLQDPLRYQLFPKPLDPTSGLGWAPHSS